VDLRQTLCGTRNVRSICDWAWVRMYPSKPGVDVGLGGVECYAKSIKIRVCTFVVIFLPMWSRGK